MRTIQEPRVDNAATVTQLLFFLFGTDHGLKLKAGQELCLA